ncbi:MAG TPA: transaldolase [Rhizorhapis sp.]|nr:transaldolase [Rhizorhapis sp.]
MKIKVYADGAKLEDMLAVLEKGAAQGFTTNPTLMRQAGITDYAGFAKTVLAKITELPISFEVFADDLPTMEKQARLIATWGANVYVKIPITNTQGASTVPLIRDLSAGGIKLNITAIMTLDQVRDVVGALSSDAPAVVSVFAGRIADTGRDPVPLMREALRICAAKSWAELLWASPREVLNIYQADEIGCHIITVTPDLIKKLSLAGKDLDEYSQETVAMFYRDATAAGFQL